MRSRHGRKGTQFAHAHSAEHVRDRDLRLFRRDLHDSIGPLLSAVTMRTEAARAMVTRDPEAADVILGELHADACHALAEVRRLAATEPRFPPRETSLAAALRLQADRFGTASAGRLTVSVAVAPTLAGVSTAVETALYRIASEALTNTARHALARSCTIRAWADDTQIHLEVADDGIGLPRRPGTGVGLRSMRDRALELGGWCVVENVVPHGTRVYATLPVNPPEPTTAAAGPAGAVRPAWPERRRQGA